jgi:hypothetical protein
MIQEVYNITNNKIGSFCETGIPNCSPAWPLGQPCTVSRRFHILRILSMNNGPGGNSKFLLPNPTTDYSEAVPGDIFDQTTPTGSRNMTPLTKGTLSAVAAF